MTTKEQLEKLVLENRFIQSPRLQKLYKELLDRLEAENKQCDINGVSRSVWMVQEKERLIVNGMFSTKEKAEKFINGSKNYAIKELSVA